MPLLTTIRDLHRRKGRERRGLALAEGVRLVEEMVAAGAACKGAVASPGLDSTPRGSRLRAALLARGVVIEALTDEALARESATEHPQGIIAVYQPGAWQLADCLPRPGAPLVILDAVQDPGNVGAIARTAAAFGASGLVALPGSADLTNPKAVRAAMGALFHLPHCPAAADDLLTALSRSGGEVWALEMQGEAVSTPMAGVAVALVLGNEGAGAHPELLARATRRVTIPIGAGAESLNVAVAAGIALYQVTR
ncbi:MAG TPA: RNA methyltransferase [Gemmatimonadales bacterium]|jgi:TrmH family RNA methyltransferase